MRSTCRAERRVNGDVTWRCRSRKSSSRFRMRQAGSTYVRILGFAWAKNRLAKPAWYETDPIRTQWPSYRMRRNGSLSAMSASTSPARSNAAKSIESADGRM